MTTHPASDPLPDSQPCPFCGSSWIVKGERYFAMCVDCGATGPERSASKLSQAKFMGDWNTRAPAPSSDPAAGEWRMLEVGEVIQEGDEYLCAHEREWKEASSIGLIFDPSELQPYRRRVATATTPLPPPTSLEELATPETDAKQVRLGMLWVTPANADLMVVRAYDVKDMERRLSALTRAVGTLQGDKARLDWLEKYPSLLAHCTWVNQQLGRIFTFDHEKKLGECSQTLRAAIDAAMLTAANDQRKGEKV